jgi:hypothetical protein
MKRQPWHYWLILFTFVSLPACFDPLVGEECASGYFWCNDECVPMGMCSQGDAGADLQETGTLEVAQDSEVGDTLMEPVGDILETRFNTGQDTSALIIDAGVITPDVPPDITVVPPIDAAMDIPVDSLPLPIPDTAVTPDSTPDESISLTPDLAVTLDLPVETTPDTAYDTMIDNSPDQSMDTGVGDGIVDVDSGTVIEVTPEAPPDSSPDTPLEDVPQEQDGPCVDCSETLDTLVLGSPSIFIRLLV